MRVLARLCIFLYELNAHQSEIRRTRVEHVIGGTMKKLAKPMSMSTLAQVVSLSTAALAVTLALAPQHTSAAAPVSSQVQVVNSSAQPVPVNGTVGATQSGAWTIGAEQSGAWNVGINGTPTVTIGNAPTAPIPTRNVDEYDRQPFQQTIIVQLGAGEQSDISGTITVPAGKRLVIENVAGQVVVPPGQIPIFLVQTDLPRHVVMAEHIGELNPGNDTWGITRRVLMYADLHVEVLLARNSTVGGAAANVTLTGHYVDR